MGDRIHFGSLEHSEKARSMAPTGYNATIPVSYAPQSAAEVLPFSETTLESQAAHRQSLLEQEARKKAKQLIVPTDDKLVQAKLRELGEPIILFGEQPPERRERLRDILSRRGIDNAMPSNWSHAGAISGPVSESKGAAEKEPDELFYTEGIPQLKAARLAIALYSLPRAKERLARAKLIKQRDDADGGLAAQQEAAEKQKIHESFNGFLNISSQVGDDRPLGFVQFAPDSEHLITTSWGGAAKLWKASDCSLVKNFKGHTDRCTSMIYHPQAATQSPSSCNLASSGADCKVMIWSLDSETPIETFTGHEHRVNRVAFHPSGRYVASASHDLTWRLWDLEAGKEILEQEGHSRAVFAIGFQRDGSLLASAGMDQIGRVWDLRSGKSTYVMRGHNKQIVCLDWSPNGYQIATASEDNTVRIWDLRKRRPVYIIPAHESLVSHVKYHPESNLIITSSFDNTCKLWHGTDWTPVKTIQANEGKVMGCDLSPNCKYIATANYDRTWKLFANEHSNDDMVI